MKKAGVLFTVVIFLLLLIGGLFFMFFEKRQFVPKVKSGEFPFSLTYKVDNGNVVNISGVYICEFDGIGWDTGRGFYRKWKGYVKETGLENVLIFEDSNTRIFCRVGDPEYLMGDYKYLAWENISLSPPHLYLKKNSNNSSYLSSEDIKNKYGIEIITWNFSEPIKNQFKK